LGNGSSNCQYIISCCQALYLKPKPRVLDVVIGFYFCFHLVHRYENMANIENLNESLMCGDFDSKLYEFKRKMMGVSCADIDVILHLFNGLQS
jgi:hypothetical protein